MVSINQVLDTFLKEQTDWKRYLMANWNTILGPIANHARIEKIEDNTLIIGVTDSAWMQELYLLSHVLLCKINQSLEQPYLKKIRFKCSTKKFFKQPTLSTKKEYQLPRHTLNFKEQRALKAINDQELSTVLEEFLMRCYEVKHL